MTRTSADSIIPKQKTGKETNTEYELNVADTREARDLFRIARDRLLDVNHWEKLCGIATADFRLTDQHGNQVNRYAQENDFFKIDIPGPGSITGRGFDWVKIEKINKTEDPGNDCESIAIRVRPAPNPKTPGNKVAHFFSERATSSFIVERRGTLVRAGVHGRNEKPNTVMNNVIDKIRNFLIAVSALAGISSVQWQNLCKGLIEGPKE